MSKLEDIKNDYKNGFPVDIDYLIKYAEKSRKWITMYEEFSDQDEDTKDRLSKQIYEIQLENERYKQALEWYAGEEKWNPTITYTPEGDMHEGTPLFIDDDGEIAREALKEVESNANSLQ